MPSLQQLINAHYVVVASDYQGQGTPSILPYLACKVTAQNGIDIVRAAHHIPGLKLSRSYLAWGYFEGVQTALFIWKIAKSYAPELHIVGVVAVDAPSGLQDSYEVLQNSPWQYYILMIVVGWNFAYGNKLAPLNEIFTPLAYRITAMWNYRCGGFADAMLTARIPLSELTKGDPNNIPAWHKLILQNDPMNFSKPTNIPLSIIQGSYDELAPLITSQPLVQHLCSVGAQVQRFIYPNLIYLNIIDPSTNDTLHWINDRFANKSFPDLTFKPVGLPVASAQDCQTGFFNSQLLKPW